MDSKTTEIKTCRDCKQEKELSDFYNMKYQGKLKGERTYYMSNCKDCYNKKQHMKYTATRKHHTKGVGTLTKDERLELYNLIKAGQNLRQIRKNNSKLAMMNYVTLYMNTRGDKLEKLISF
jgi:hypothetical protein